jgi:cell wall-associated NlpC family hydrolase
MIATFAFAMLLAAPPQATVEVPVANMHSRPTLEADVVSQAIYGAVTTVLEESAGWKRVRTADDYTGWMQASQLHAGVVSGRTATVAALFANLYREPDVTKHAPLIVLPYESRIEIVAEPKDNLRWLEARLVDGRTAWVQRGDLEFEAHTLSIDETIALAKRFLGLPYTWGGTSSYGYDCSGFMQMLARRRGYVLPRDAGPQAHWTRMVAVEKSALKPGDLLYFGRSGEKITHTGLYIGNGEFLHATTHQHPVSQISRLADEHWTRIFVCARRIQ